MFIASYERQEILACLMFSSSQLEVAEVFSIHKGLPSFISMTFFIQNIEFTFFSFRLTQIGKYFFDELAIYEEFIPFFHYHSNENFSTSFWFFENYSLFIIVEK